MNSNIARPLGVNDPGLPDEMIVGADGIAVAIYGPVEGIQETNVRRIYHAIKKGDLSTFKLGGRVHARRSTIVKWIENQEGAA